MSRASELVAVATIALFAVGLAFRRLPMFARVFISVDSRNVFYAVPPEAGAFALGALFGVFAFVYSLWMVRMNQTAAAWHFWLSTVGTVLLGMGMVGLANVAQFRYLRYVRFHATSPSPSPRLPQRLIDNLGLGGAICASCSTTKVGQQLPMIQLVSLN